MISPRSSRLGSSVLALAIAFGALWALTGCTSSDSTPTKVLGKQAERTTTTLAFDDTPSEVAPQTPDRDVVMEVLVDRVPSLDGLGYNDIRVQLLDTVCDEIDQDDGDFVAVGDAIVEASSSNFEFSYSDAGYIVAAAVVLECPEWQDAAREFANG